MPSVPIDVMVQKRNFEKQRSPGIDFGCPRDSCAKWLATAIFSEGALLPPAAAYPVLRQRQANPTSELRGIHVNRLAQAWTAYKATGSRTQGRALEKELSGALGWRPQAQGSTEKVATELDP